MSTSSNAFTSRLQEFNEDNNILLSLLLTDSRLHLAFDAALETHSPIDDLRNAYLSLQQLHQFIRYLRTPTQDTPRMNVNLALSLASHAATQLDNSLTTTLNQLGALDVLIDIDCQLRLSSMPSRDVTAPSTVSTQIVLPVPSPSVPSSYEEQVTYLRAKKPKKEQIDERLFITRPTRFFPHPILNITTPASSVDEKATKRRTAVSINAPNASVLPLGIATELALASEEAPLLSFRRPPLNLPPVLAAPAPPAPTPSDSLGKS